MYRKIIHCFKGRATSYKKVYEKIIMRFEKKCFIPDMVKFRKCHLKDDINQL